MLYYKATKIRDRVCRRAFGDYPNALLLLIEEGGLFLELIAAYHPLLLLTAGGLGGGDGALDTVDDPAVFVGIIVSMEDLNDWEKELRPLCYRHSGRRLEL